MPDKSANDLFEYAKKQGLDWGTIDTIPELPGVAVRYSGHVGVYIGNGEVVEERGFNYGCVITKLKDRNWLHWYRIPGLKYIEVNSVATQQLGARLLKKGLKGDDVKELQHLLNELIGTNLVEDGDFGNATFEAVKKFQGKYGLNADGIYGEKSHLALMSAIADREPEPDEPKDELIPVINGYKTTGSVNVRAGNSASYAILTTLAKNTKLEPLVNAQGEPLITDNGWYAISILGQIGWISGKYVGVM